MRRDWVANISEVAALACDPGRDFGANMTRVLGEKYFCLIAIDYYG
jgi:hypothetical protein